MFNENIQTGDPGHAALHRKIARHLNGALSVRSYGAVGDGVTDDTTAIRNAIASLPAGRTTKERVILTGSIVISGTIIIPDYTILEIRGRIKLANNANVDMFRAGNGKCIEICGGGEIDGNRANQSAGVGIYIQSGQDVLIENIYIHDCREQNIRVRLNSSRITVRNVRAVDGQAGNIYFLQGTVAGTQPEITESTIESCTCYYTFKVASVANIALMNARHLTIMGNHTYGACDFGIHVEEHLYDSIIQNNIIHDHTQDGIRFGYGTGNVFNGNVTYRNGYRGISVAGGGNLNTIHGNIVRENGWSGITLEDCSYNLVEGNNVWNNNQSLNAVYNAGIQILSVGLVAPTYNAIRSNTASDNQVIKTQQYGVTEGGALADYNVIEYNDVRGNALGPVNNIQRGLWGVNHTKIRSNLGGFNQVNFVANDATPSVGIDIGLYYTANIKPTTITMFDDGESGQAIKVLIKDANTTIDFTGTNLKGNGGADWQPANGDWLDAVFDGTNWYCSVHNAT